MLRGSWRCGGAVLAALAVLSAAGCGDDGRQPAAAAATGAAPASDRVACGNGKAGRATGDPIRLGAIVTKQPGLDFTGITGAAKAYFDCLNDNGGIGGRPVRYIVDDEQTNPQQVASLATRLVENEKVLALVGNASILDCAVNAPYYAKHGLNVVVAGIPNDCYTSPAIAAVNSGPQLSDLGAAQYLREQGAKSLILSTTAGPGAEASLQAALGYGRKEGIRSSGDLQKVPITDAEAVVLKLVDLAGEGGGVVLAYTPPDALKLLKAAESQGLIDKVHWACPTSCNDASLVKALGPAWDGRLGVDAELSLPESGDPDNTLYRAVMARYAPGAPLGSFGQMGFLSAKIVSDALQGLPASELTRPGVNAAIKAVKGYRTGILCKPWYFGDLPAHVPSNTNRTLVPQGGRFVEKEGCFELAAVTPQLRAARAYERQQAGG